MQQTTNYQLNKPEASDYADIAPISENMEKIDAQLKAAQNHREDGDIHVTSTDKQNWNNKAPGSLSETVSSLSDALDSLGSAVSGHTGNSTIHVTGSEKAKWNGYSTIHGLSYSKSGTTHALTGLSGVSGTVSCVFTATAAYSAGDTITVDGTAYTIQLSNGEAAEDNLFVSGASVPVVIDTAGKKVNFKAAGGGAKLPAGTETILNIYTSDDNFEVPTTGDYRITAIGHGGTGGYGDAMDHPIAGISVEGGHGGGAGGIATILTKLSKGDSYVITVNNAQSSFGNLVSATCGQAGSYISGGKGGTGAGDQSWVGGDGKDAQDLDTRKTCCPGAAGGDTAADAPFGGATGSPGTREWPVVPNDNRLTDENKKYLVGDETKAFGMSKDGTFGFGAGAGGTAAIYGEDMAYYIDKGDPLLPPGASGAIIIEKVF